ncbi:MAG: RagB/SusD family nutrient uptake outer membrane protein [Cytophagales bacterium]|nr:RagB/SusD family nutrient uptake outer membrane protein [Cytophagales bacterium]
MHSLIKYFTLFLFPLFLFPSCEKDLELYPKDKIIEESFFTEAKHYELFSNRFYYGLPNFNTLYSRENVSDLVANWGGSPVSDGSYTPSPNSELWNSSYNIIRSASYLLEKSQEADDKLKEAVKTYVGETHFFRAFAYFNLLRDFGGVPIVKAPLALDDKEILYGPRNTREEVVNLILSDLNDAIEAIPMQADISGKNLGRISKEAAYAFKARVALFEGTWRKFRGQDGNALLEEAVNASAEVLKSPSFELFDKRDALGEESYRYMFILDKLQSNPAFITKSANREYVLARRYDADFHPAWSPGGHNLPSPTRKLADMFLCSDGLPIDKSPMFKGRNTITSEHENRDKRMTNILVVPKTKYWVTFPDEMQRRWDNPDGGGFIYGVSFTNETTTGYFRRKGMVEIKKPYSPDTPVIRLAEVMLIYAEALYERNGSVTDEQLNMSINKLRARVGMPALTNAFAAANGLNMQEEIRRERTIELFLEGHRIDDLRRWKTAETEMSQALKGVKYSGTQYEKEPWSSIDFKLDSDGNIVYQKASNRVFEEKHYLFPLPTHQIELNPKLKQNPGWN